MVHYGNILMIIQVYGKFYRKSFTHYIRWHVKKYQIYRKMEQIVNFIILLDRACPKRTAATVACVDVLMAYYFSSCDIFEEPQ